MQLNIIEMDFIVSTLNNFMEANSNFYCEVFECEPEDLVSSYGFGYSSNDLSKIQYLWDSTTVEDVTAHTLRDILYMCKQGLTLDYVNSLLEIK